MSEERPDLNGEWIGHYPGHFDEVIRIMQENDHVLAVKLTGDEHVPAGNVTWWADLRTGEGEGQIADWEYRNPRFVPGSLTIKSEERIVFCWSNLGEVEYRRDD
ncbi:MAG: Cyclin D1-binding domain-containing protein [Verrucomicrobia subdivision 3 bacterium]|nr:Cyclin D1-binding domain-containing protein [Limisphaerales bacterium]